MENVPVLVVGALFLMVNYFVLRHIIKTANESTNSLVVLLEEALRSAREDTAHALEIAKSIAELIPGRADDELVQKIIKMHEQLFKTLLGEEQTADGVADNDAV